MISVLITVPCEHWMRAEVAFALLKLQKDRRYQTEFMAPFHKPYEANQHHIIKDLLESDHDFWLSIDSDNPPRRNALDLVELDRDIIGLPTPVWCWRKEKDSERPIYWNAYRLHKEEDGYKEWLPRDGLQKVDAIGTGCFLVHRRVFEHPSMQKGAFKRKWYPDGTIRRGNDLAFCERAKRAGFKIYCHFDYACDHFHEVNLNDIGMSINGILRESGAAV